MAVTVVVRVRVRVLVVVVVEVEVVMDRTVVREVYVTTVVVFEGQGRVQRSDLKQPDGQAVAPMVQRGGETVQRSVTSWAVVVVTRRARRPERTSWEGLSAVK